MTRCPGLRAVLILLTGLILAVTPVAAQRVPPITFADTTPMTVTWPEPVEATIFNTTNETLHLTVTMTDFTDRDGEMLLTPAETFEPVPASLTVPPAGETTLRVPVRLEQVPAPGSYTGSLVLEVQNQNAVVRKAIVVNVPGDIPFAIPAVDRWTVNAIRVLPFTKPVCLRGLLPGCTMPVRSAGESVELPAVVDYLTNDRGGGLELQLTGYRRQNARFDVDFDRAWGFVGAYTGVVDFVPAVADVGTVAFTVEVKDMILWPLLTLVAGVLAARFVQRYMTVGRMTGRLLRRLATVGAYYDGLRKSFYGYTIAESFRTQQEQLQARIAAWSRAHYGEPTEEEERELRATIIDPLNELERQVAVWGQFRPRLDQLRRRLEHDAVPAIRRATAPKDVDIDQGEPRFFRSAVRLLSGRELAVPEVADYAVRIDKAAEMARSWGELYRVAVLVGEAIRQLQRSDVELSPHEQEMLETARHSLNSAVRDLWEARNLDALQARETRGKLINARELTRQLIDPIVYYAGAEVTARQLTEPGDGDDVMMDFPATVTQSMQPLVRSYALIDTMQLPQIDFEIYEDLPSDTARIAYVERTMLLGERTLAWVALAAALIAGLDRYFDSSFGTLGDYLTLFAWAITAKIGLELANMAASRLLSAWRERGTLPL